MPQPGRARIESVPRIDTDLIALLRTDLAAADFTVDTVRGLWSDSAGGALSRLHRVPAQRELAAARAAGELTPAGTLAWLFVLGLPVSGAELDAALPELAADGAAALGLVELEASAPDSDLITPLVDLRPYGFTDARGQAEWWLASDLGELALGHALGPEHVLGVGGASTTLSSLIIGSDVELALDLGTGCGIQAMHVSRFARRVIATDISARALEYAEFNARLNGIEGIEFRLGSLFEPVAGERFDRIVSNPPFVITPRVADVPEYEYRDGGFTGDELVQRVIAGVREHLAPGGVAQLLGNWEYLAGAEGLDRVRSWTEGLDAWVVERELQDAPRYAETWIRDGGTRPGDPEFDVWYDRWLEDFSARGVEYVGFGYLTLRAPLDGEPTLTRFEQVESSGTNPAGIGAHVERALAAHDAVQGMTDAALAELRLKVASDVTEERHSWPGDEAPIVISLRQGAGFGRAVQVDPALSGLVGACDGELTVGQISDAIAALFEVDAAELRADLLPRVRELLFTGFVDLA
ncbi:methyltransferase [Gryllotalpicola daejeonensis]|uniref:Methyltransferase n=1 Tax=Gryllotalpicola daejeonensis TaxID=993087 RepID=A0ABP7ZG20_9MICO